MSRQVAAFSPFWRLGDLGYADEREKEVFARKVSELPFFRGTEFESIRDLTLYITIPPKGDTTAYEAQMQGLREMLE